MLATQFVAVCVADHKTIKSAGYAWMKLKVPCVFFTVPQFIPNEFLLFEVIIEEPHAFRRNETTA